LPNQEMSAPSAVYTPRRTDRNRCTPSAW